MTVGVFLQPGGGPFRHTLVPQQLDVQETFEITVLPLGMHVVDLLQATAIGGVVPIELLRNPRLLLFAETLQTPCLDLIGDLPLQIQRDHRDAVFPGVAEDRAIEPVIVTPAFEILRLADEFRLVDLARHVVVQYRLEGLEEELQTDRQNRMAGMLTLDHGQLIEMVLIAVMGLADKDDLAVRDLFDQPAHADQAGEVDDSGHRHLWLIRRRDPTHGQGRQTRQQDFSQQRNPLRNGRYRNPEAELGFRIEIH